MNKATKNSFLIIGSMFALSTTLADTIITGTTFETTYNIVTDKIEYKILPNVKITVFREAVALFDAPKLSDAQGIFTVNVPPGGPFRMVFRADKKTPQIQQLAGIDDYKYKVAIVLEEKTKEITEACKDFSNRKQEKIEEDINRIEFSKSQFKSSSALTKSDEIDFDNRLKILRNISIYCLQTTKETTKETTKDNTITSISKQNPHHENENDGNIPAPKNLRIIDPANAH